MRLYISSHGVGAEKARLTNLGGRWVRGGNTFVLREAMRRSGFDEAIGGFCVLAPSLTGLQHVDDPWLHPYGDGDPKFEGLGLLDHLSLPHYRSDHFESPKIELEVAYCEAQGITYRTHHRSGKDASDGAQRRRVSGACWVASVPTYTPTLN